MARAHDDDLKIGSHRRGMVLVCHGDDQPDQFALWLQSLVSDFERLFSVASEFGVDLDPQDETSPIVSVMDFCERLGIEFDSTMWEGSRISGIYRVGWMKVGTVRSAATRGRRLLQALEKHANIAIRSQVMHELEAIKGLDEFLDRIDRTDDNRAALRQQAASLTASLQVTEAALDAANRALRQASENDASEIDLACIRLASALLTGEKSRLVAGPLVLWDDGVVYAICNWGGSPIPRDSAPALLLEGIQRSGHRVVRVREATIIGGFLSGPIYRKGPSNISGWSKVWSHRERRERTFYVDPPEHAERVCHIHRVLSFGAE